MDLVAQLQAIEEAKKQELLATKRKYGQLYDGKIDELAFKNRDNGEFLRKEVSKSQMRMQAVKSGIYVQDAITKVEVEHTYPPIISRYVTEANPVPTPKAEELIEGSTELPAGG